MKLIALYCAHVYKDRTLVSTYYLPTVVNCHTPVEQMVSALVQEYELDGATLTLEDLLTHYKYEVLNQFCDMPTAAHETIFGIYKQHSALNSDADAVCTSTTMEALIPFADNIRCEQLHAVSVEDTRHFDLTQLRQKSGPDFRAFLQQNIIDDPTLGTRAQWLLDGKIELDTRFGGGDSTQIQILHIAPELYANGLTFAQLQSVQFLVDKYLKDVNCDNYQRKTSLAYNEALATHLLASDARLVPIIA